MVGITESPVVPDTNTPVQTPSSDSYFHQSGGEKTGNLMQKDVEPQKPLSPPNPSPSPEKHKLDEDNDIEESSKRAKVEASGETPAVPSESMDDASNEASKEPVPQNGHAEEPVENTSHSGQPVAPPSMTPAPKPASEPDMDNLPQNPMPKHQNKFASITMKAIKRLRDASPFLHPVDIVKLNIPFYYNYITRPMDLSTIEKKLNVNAYEDPNQLVNDFNLMVSNCCRFNGENSGISKMAKNIQAHFEKHMLNMPPKILSSEGAVSGSAAVSSSAKSKRRAVLDTEDKKESVATRRPKRTIHPPKSKELPYDIKPKNKKHAAELRFCNQTVKELVSKKHYSYNFPFLAPVDTVALNIPHYNDVVKQPMDLGTIQSKLTNSEYENGDEFERDVRLVFKNCYLFNPEGTEVNMMGHRLEAVFDKKWQNRPLPAPTPLQSEDDYSEDDDDEGEIDDSVLSSVPAIQFLENQLTRMKQELDELKKQHLTKLKEQKDAKKKKKRSKRSRNGGSRKNSAHDVNSQPAVTYEMKKQVSESVPNLSDKKLQSLIKIIKDDVEISNEDEVELDMDQLEDRTVLKLYNFLFGKKQSGSALKKKKKLYSTGNVDELQQLRSQLALFENADKGSSGKGQHMNLNQESSDDDDEDASSESSEEE